MEKIHVKTAIIIALIATVLGSLIVPSLVTARTGIMAGTSSAVFSVVDTDPTGLFLGEENYEPIQEIMTPYIGRSMYYKVECECYLSQQTSLAYFAIGVDSMIIPEPTTERLYGHTQIDVFYTGVHIERVFHLGPGYYWFFFLGKESEGIGGSLCKYMSITVTVFTHGSLEEPVAEFKVDVDSTNPSEP